MHSAQHTASLPEMSAIIRTCTSLGSGNAKPHFIKRENYVKRRKLMYTNKASKQCHPIAPLTFLGSQSFLNSGLISICLRHSALSPLASLLFLKHASRPLYFLFPRYTKGSLPHLLYWYPPNGTFSIWPIQRTLSYVPVLFFFARALSIEFFFLECEHNEGRDFIFFVHSCAPRAWNSAWHTVGAQ